jgi:hypothetical protein
MTTTFHAPSPFIGASITTNTPMGFVVAISSLFGSQVCYFKRWVSSFCCYLHQNADSYRTANSSFGGTMKIGLVEVDYWRFTYTCPWIRPPVNLTLHRLPAYTVQRDIYTLAGTGTPFRMNETLISSFSTFSHLLVGPQDESLFRIENCITQQNNASFLQYCNQYNSQTRIGYLGFG